MKILMVNKFLYPNGGSETYVFKLGEYFISQGHEVQYFGMEHDGRIVGNRVNAYTSDMDFHGGSKLSKLTYPVKTIYSSEARKKIRLVLEDFQPDVVHLNNFNYQLTPSIILEIVAWREKKKHQCKIVYTAHDYQLICPNHMLNNPNSKQNCEKCIDGHYMNCIKGKCIHGSTAKSMIGSLEALYWNVRKTYKYIDKVICISKFEESMIRHNRYLQEKTYVIYNFSSIERITEVGEKKGYVLYFGRYSEEKGFRTLVNACKLLPEVPFVFAGTGPLESIITDAKNIRNVGFQTGESLKKYIREANFAVVPSEWYEPFGLTIIESQCQGTPVLGAQNGAIPELISDGVNGVLFIPGNVKDLSEKIQELWSNKNIVDSYSRECIKANVKNVSAYGEELLEIYKS